MTILDIADFVARCIGYVVIIWSSLGVIILIVGGWLYRAPKPELQRPAIDDRPYAWMKNDELMYALTMSTDHIGEVNGLILGAHEPQPLLDATMRAVQRTRDQINDELGIRQREREKAK